MSAAPPAARPAPMSREQLKLGDSVRVEGPFGASHLRESPSRADHRRRRRLGPGADQVDRRARARDGAAAAHPSLFRRPHRARPLPGRPFRGTGREAHEPALHAGAERRRRRRPAHRPGARGGRRRLRRVRRLQGLSRRPAGHGRGGDAAVRAARHAARSTSTPTPSTPRPKWPGPARRRERNYDGTSGRTRRASSPAPAAASAAPSPSSWSPRARSVIVADVGASIAGDGGDPDAGARGRGGDSARRRSPSPRASPRPASPSSSSRLAMKSFGGIDIVVNNAAILRDAFVFHADPRDWDAVIRNNLSAAFYLINAASGVMREQGKSGRGGTGGYDWGRIVNIVSSAGLYGNFGQAAYASAKAGLFGLTRVTAMDLARAQITVNAVAPFAAHPRHRHHPARQRRAEDLQGARAQDRRAPRRQPRDGAVLAGRQGHHRPAAGRARPRGLPVRPAAPRRASLKSASRRRWPQTSPPSSAASSPT